MMIINTHNKRRQFAKEPFWKTYCRPIKKSNSSCWVKFRSNGHTHTLIIDLFGSERIGQRFCMEFLSLSSKRIKSKLAHLLEEKKNNLYTRRWWLGRWFKPLNYINDYAVSIPLPRPNGVGQHLTSPHCNLGFRFSHIITLFEIGFGIDASKNP